MTVLKAMSRRVAVYAPGAPSFTIAEHLRDAATEFCARTRCWRHVVTWEIIARDKHKPVYPMGAPMLDGAGDPLTDDEGEVIYDMDSSEFGLADEDALAASVIHQIEDASLDNVPLIPVAYASIDPRVLAEVGPGRYVTQIDPRAVIIAPRGAGVLRLSLFLKPDVAVPQVPEDFLPAFMVSQFGMAIVAGAVARLLMIPGTPYSNPQIASVQKLEFERACDANFAVSIQGQQNAPIRMKPSFM